MMRMVVGLVAVLGVAVAQASPADACGVHLPGNTRGPKHKVRSSNPSRVLVVGTAGKSTLTRELRDKGHTVEVAASARAAPGGRYQVVIVDGADPKLMAAAAIAYPGAQIVARSDSTRASVHAVEQRVARRVVDRTRVVPRDSATRDVKHAGSRPDGSVLVGAGGDETVTPRSEVPVARDAPLGTTAPRVAPPQPERGRRAQLHRELAFGGGSDLVSSKVASRLDASARWLAANPDKSITIEGHASQVGSAEVNQALSEARASAVKDYLVAQGVDAARIQVVGRGFEAPAYQPASSARNRRVTIIVNE